MQLPPPEVLASWPVPNYVDPVTRGHAVNIVNIVLGVLAFIVTVLRLYTRFKITCTPGFDDALVVIAFVCCTAAYMLIRWNYLTNDRLLELACVSLRLWRLSAGVRIGIYGMYPCPGSQLSPSTISLSSLPFLCPAQSSSSRFCGSASALSEQGVRDFTRYTILSCLSPWCLWPCAALSSCWSASSSARKLALFSHCGMLRQLTIFSGRPIHAFWDLEPMYPHHCVDYGAAVFSASVVNISTDFLCTILPMPLIWNLKLPARQRLAVISIFGLGIVVNVAGTVRTVYVWKSMMDSYDSTWMGWPILLAGSIEINLAMV